MRLRIKWFSKFTMVVAFMVVVGMSFSGLAEASAITWVPLKEPGSGGKIASLIVSPFNSQKVLVGGDMLGAAVSNDGGSSWNSSVGFPMWEMAEFTFHPSNSSTIWVAAAGGPFLSTDGGVNWTSKRSGMGTASSSYFTAPIQKIIYYDPVDNDKLLAFGGSHRQWDGGFTANSQVGAVWKSTDHGTSWTKIATLPSAGNGKNIMSAYLASDGTLYAAVDGAGVYKSTNQGANWSPINTGLPGGGTSVAWITGKPNNAATLYVALRNYDSGSGTYASGGIYKSVNSGSSWFASNTGLNQTTGTASTASSYKIVTVAPSTPSTLYTGDLNHGTVYKSTDNGVSWASVLTSSSTAKAYPAGPSAEFIEVDPGNAQNVFVGTAETIFKTSDGGTSWTDSTSIASGSNWVGRGYSGLVARGFGFNPKNSVKAAFVGMDAGKFWHSADSLQTWSRASSGLEKWQGARGLTFSGSGGNTIYATLGQKDFRGIGRSTDGGSNWKMLSGNGLGGNGGSGEVANGLPNYQTGSKPGNIYAHPDLINDVWAIVNGKIYKTTNGTSSSSTWSTVGPSGVEFRTIAAAKGFPLTFYVTSDQGIYKTTNGSNFTQLSGFNYPTDYVAVDPNDPDVIYFTREEEDDSVKANGLYKYDGSVWTRLSVPDSHNGKYLYAVDVDPHDSDRIVVTSIDNPSKDISGAEGVFFSQDGGANWTKENSGLPLLRVGVAQFNPNIAGQIIVGTNGRGFFKGTFTP
jgi:hypothetical protein